MGILASWVVQSNVFCITSLGSHAKYFRRRSQSRSRDFTAELGFLYTMLACGGGSSSKVGCGGTWWCFSPLWSRSRSDASLGSEADCWGFNGMDSTSKTTDRFELSGSLVMRGPASRSNVVGGSLLAQVALVGCPGMGQYQGCPQDRYRSSHSRRWVEGTVRTSLGDRCWRRDDHEGLESCQ